MGTTEDEMATAGRNLNYPESTIIKGRILNEKFKKEEARIRDFSNKLQDSLNKQKLDGIIDDFNYLTRLNAFSSNEATNKKYGVELGDPI